MNNSPVIEKWCFSFLWLSFFALCGTENRVYKQELYVTFAATNGQHWAAVLFCFIFVYSWHSTPGDATNQSNCSSSAQRFHVTWLLDLLAFQTQELVFAKKLQNWQFSFRKCCCSAIYRAWGFAQKADLRLFMQSLAIVTLVNLDGSTMGSNVNAGFGLSPTH